MKVGERLPCAEKSSRTGPTARNSPRGLASREVWPLGSFGVLQGGF